jgi:aminopeptidase N
VWFVSYWYPQLAVYDDVTGWQFDPYMGRSEFYMGYGDYDVALTVPEGWLIASTGELVNGEEVLSAQSRERLAQSRRSRGITTIVGEADFGAGRATARGADGKLTWRFRARNVRDFDFGASARYQWDATIAEVGDHNGDGRPDTAAAYAFWRPDYPAWRDGARYVQYSVEFLSRWLWPYPWPQMTVVNGVRSCGGMEYPMITCIGGGRAAQESTGVFGTTLHETAHMWFPMMVGSDEKTYAWQDEGLTTFNTDRGVWEYRGSRPGPHPYRGSQQSYLGFARAGQEVELMRHGDLYPPFSPAYGVASYPKMAANTASLLALLGDSTFLRAYREYGRRWLYRHPMPWDFFNTFNDVSGRDLWWFWRTWWYETWTLDHAIASVTPEGEDLALVIEDRGWAPMPAHVVVTRTDSTTERLAVPVETWLGGATRATLRVARAATVARIEIDPEQRFPDTDRANQVWRRAP